MRKPLLASLVAVALWALAEGKRGCPVLSGAKLQVRELAKGRLRLSCKRGLVFPLQGQPAKLTLRCKGKRYVDVKTKEEVEADVDCAQPRDAVQDPASPSEEEEDDEDYEEGEDEEDAEDEENDEYDEDEEGQSDYEDDDEDDEEEEADAEDQEDYEEDEGESNEEEEEEEDDYEEDDQDYEEDEEEVKDDQDEDEDEEDEDDFEEDDEEDSDEEEEEDDDGDYESDDDDEADEEDEDASDEEGDEEDEEKLEDSDEADADEEEDEEDAEDQDDYEGDEEVEEGDQDEDEDDNDDDDEDEDEEDESDYEEDEEVEDTDSKADPAEEWPLGGLVVEKAEAGKGKISCGSVGGHEVHAGGSLSLHCPFRTGIKAGGAVVGGRLLRVLCSAEGEWEVESVGKVEGELTCVPKPQARDTLCPELTGSHIDKRPRSLVESSVEEVECKEGFGFVHRPLWAPSKPLLRSVRLVCAKGRWTTLGPKPAAVDPTVSCGKVPACPVLASVKGDKEHASEDEVTVTCPKGQAINLNGGDLGLMAAARLRCILRSPAKASWVISDSKAHKVNPSAVCKAAPAKLRSPKCPALADDEHAVRLPQHRDSFHYLLSCTTGFGLKRKGKVVRELSVRCHGESWSDEAGKHLGPKALRCRPLKSCNTDWIMTAGLVSSSSAKIFPPSGSGFLGCPSGKRISYLGLGFASLSLRCVQEATGGSGRAASALLVPETNSVPAHPASLVCRDAPALPPAPSCAPLQSPTYNVTVRGGKEVQLDKTQDVSVVCKKGKGFVGLWRHPVATALVLQCRKAGARGFDWFHLKDAGHAFDPSRECQDLPLCPRLFDHPAVDYPAIYPLAEVHYGCPSSQRITVGGVWQSSASLHCFLNKRGKAFWAAKVNEQDVPVVAEDLRCRDPATSPVSHLCPALASHAYDVAYAQKGLEGEAARKVGVGAKLSCDAGHAFTAQGRAQRRLSVSCRAGPKGLPQWRHDLQERTVFHPNDGCTELKACPAVATRHTRRPIKGDMRPPASQPFRCKKGYAFHDTNRGIWYESATLACDFSSGESVWHLKVGERTLQRGAWKPLDCEEKPASSGLKACLNPKARAKDLDRKALRWAMADAGETLKVSCKEGKSRRVGDAFVRSFHMRCTGSGGWESALDGRPLLESGSSAACVPTSPCPSLAAVFGQGKGYRFYPDSAITLSCGEGQRLRLPATGLPYDSLELQCRHTRALADGDDEDADEEKAPTSEWRHGEHSVDVSGVRCEPKPPANESRVRCPELADLRESYATSPPAYQRSPNAAVQLLCRKGLAVHRGAKVLRTAWLRCGLAEDGELAWHVVGSPKDALVSPKSRFPPDEPCQPMKACTRLPHQPNKIFYPGSMATLSCSSGRVMSVKGLHLPTVQAHCRSAEDGSPAWQTEFDHQWVPLSVKDLTCQLETFNLCPSSTLSDPFPKGLAKRPGLTLEGAKLSCPPGEGLRLGGAWQREASLRCDLASGNWVLRGSKNVPVTPDAVAGPNGCRKIPACSPLNFNNSREMVEGHEWRPRSSVELLCRRGFALAFRGQKLSKLRLVCDQMEFKYNGMAEQSRMGKRVGDLVALAAAGDASPSRWSLAFSETGYEAKPNLWLSETEAAELKCHRLAKRGSKGSKRRKTSGKAACPAFTGEGLAKAPPSGQVGDSVTLSCRKGFVFDVPATPAVSRLRLVCAEASGAREWRVKNASAPAALVKTAFRPATGCYRVPKCPALLGGAGSAAGRVAVRECPEGQALLEGPASRRLTPALSLVTGLQQHLFLCNNLTRKRAAWLHVRDRLSGEGRRVNVSSLRCQPADSKVMQYLRMYPHQEAKLREALAKGAVHGADDVDVIESKLAKFKFTDAAEPKAKDVCPSPASTSGTEVEVSGRANGSVGFVQCPEGHVVPNSQRLDLRKAHIECFDSGDGRGVWRLSLSPHSPPEQFLTKVPSSPYTGCVPLPLCPALSLPASFANRTRQSAAAFRFRERGRNTVPLECASPAARARLGSGGAAEALVCERETTGALAWRTAKCGEGHCGVTVASADELLCGPLPDASAMCPAVPKAVRRGKRAKDSARLGCKSELRGVFAGAAYLGSSPELRCRAGRWLDEEDLPLAVADLKCRTLPSCASPAGSQAKYLPRSEYKVQCQGDEVLTILGHNYRQASFHCELDKKQARWVMRSGLSSSVPVPDGDIASVKCRPEDIVCPSLSGKFYRTAADPQFVVLTCEKGYLFPGGASEATVACTSKSDGTKRWQKDGALWDVARSCVRVSQCPSPSEAPRLRVTQMERSAPIGRLGSRIRLACKDQRKMVKMGKNSEALVGAGCLLTGRETADALETAWHQLLPTGRARRLHLHKLRCRKHKLRVDKRCKRLPGVVEDMASSGETRLSCPPGQVLLSPDGRSVFVSTLVRCDPETQTFTKDGETVDFACRSTQACPVIPLQPSREPVLPGSELWVSCPAGAQMLLPGLPGGSRRVTAHLRCAREPWSGAASWHARDVQPAVGQQSHWSPVDSSHLRCKTLWGDGDSCPRLRSDRDGVKVDSSDGESVGARAVIRCDFGQRVVGSDSESVMLDCERRGGVADWYRGIDAELPFAVESVACEAEPVCPRPQLVDVDANDVFYPGASVSYACKGSEAMAIKEPKLNYQALQLKCLLSRSRQAFWGVRKLATYEGSEELSDFRPLSPKDALQCKRLDRKPSCPAFRGSDILIRAHRRKKATLACPSGSSLRVARPKGPARFSRIVHAKCRGGEWRDRSLTFDPATSCTAFRGCRNLPPRLPPPGVSRIDPPPTDGAKSRARPGSKTYAQCQGADIPATCDGEMWKWPGLERPTLYPRCPSRLAVCPSLTRNSYLVSSNGNHVGASARLTCLGGGGAVYDHQSAPRIKCTEEGRWETEDGKLFEPKAEENACWRPKSCPLPDLKASNGAYLVGRPDPLRLEYGCLRDGFVFAANSEARLIVPCPRQGHKPEVQCVPPEGSRCPPLRRHLGKGVESRRIGDGNEGLSCAEGDLVALPHSHKEPLLNMAVHCADNRWISVSHNVPLEGKVRCVERVGCPDLTAKAGLVTEATTESRELVLGCSGAGRLWLNGQAHQSGDEDPARQALVRCHPDGHWRIADSLGTVRGQDPALVGLHVRHDLLHCRNLTAHCAFPKAENLVNTSRQAFPVNETVTFKCLPAYGPEDHLEGDRVALKCEAFKGATWWKAASPSSAPGHKASYSPFVFKSLLMDKADSQSYPDAAPARSKSMAGSSVLPRCVRKPLCPQMPRIHLSDARRALGVEHPFACPNDHSLLVGEVQVRETEVRCERGVWKGALGWTVRVGDRRVAVDASTLDCRRMAQTKGLAFLSASQEKTCPRVVHHGFLAASQQRVHRFAFDAVCPSDQGPKSRFLSLECREGRWLSGEERAKGLACREYLKEDCAKETGKLVSTLAYCSDELKLASAKEAALPGSNVSSLCGGRFVRLGSGEVVGVSELRCVELSWEPNLCPTFSGASLGAVPPRTEEGGAAALHCAAHHGHLHYGMRQELSLTCKRDKDGWLQWFGPDGKRFDHTASCTEQPRCPNIHASLSCRRYCDGFQGMNGSRHYPGDSRQLYCLPGPYIQLWDHFKDKKEGVSRAGIHCVKGRGGVPIWQLAERPKVPVEAIVCWKPSKRPTPTMPPRPTAAPRAACADGEACLKAKACPDITVWAAGIFHQNFVPPTFHNREATIRCPGQGNHLPWGGALSSDRIRCDFHPQDRDRLVWHSVGTSKPIPETRSVLCKPYKPCPAPPEVSGRKETWNATFARLSCPSEGRLCGRSKSGALELECAEGQWRLAGSSTPASEALQKAGCSVSGSEAGKARVCHGRYPASSVRLCLGREWLLGEELLSDAEADRCHLLDHRSDVDGFKWCAEVPLGSQLPGDVGSSHLPNCHLHLHLHLIAFSIDLFCPTKWSFQLRRVLLASWKSERAAVVVARSASDGRWRRLELGSGLKGSPYATVQTKGLPPRGP